MIHTIDYYHDPGSADAFRVDLLRGRYRVTFERARPELPDGAQWDGNVVIWRNRKIFLADGVVVSTFVDGQASCCTPTWAVDAFRADGQLPGPLDVANGEGLDAFADACGERRHPGEPDGDLRERLRPLWRVGEL
jgi:hypothetical protein